MNIQDCLAEYGFQMELREAYAFAYWLTEGQDMRNVYIYADKHEDVSVWELLRLADELSVLIANLEAANEAAYYGEIT